MDKILILTPISYLSTAEPHHWPCCFSLMCHSDHLTGTPLFHMSGFVTNFGPLPRDHRVGQRSPWILGLAQGDTSEWQDPPMPLWSRPNSKGSGRSVALLVLTIQGADGQRSSVVGTNAVARTKIGQKASREGMMGESENVGAIVSHIIEGDITGLII